MKELARRAFEKAVTLSFYLLKRSKINKKILSYLSEKDWSAENAVVNETFKDFGITKEEYVARLHKLSKKDFLEYNRPFGSGPFVRITQKGKNRLKFFGKRALNYLLKNWIGLATLFFTMAGILFSFWFFNQNQIEKPGPIF